MFSQVFVCSQGGLPMERARSALGGREGSLHGWGFCMEGVCMEEGSAWRRGSASSGGLHGGWACMEGPDPLYGKPAVGTHPTGMHSCSFS